MSEEIILQTTNQAAFEDLLDDLKWRVVRQEDGRIIIERASTGQQGEIREANHEHD